MTSSHSFSSIGLDIHGHLADHGVFTEPPLGQVIESNIAGAACGIDPAHCQAESEHTWRGYSTAGESLRPQREFGAVHAIVAAHNEAPGYDLDDVQRVLVGCARERDPFIRQIESDGKAFCQQEGIRYRPLHEKTVYEIVHARNEQKGRMLPLCGSQLEQEIQATIAHAINSVLSGNRGMTMSAGLMRHLMRETMDAANAFRHKASHAHSHIGTAPAHVVDISALKLDFKTTMENIVKKYKKHVPKLPDNHCQHDEDDDEKEISDGSKAHCRR